jgi:hypothetical protein
MFNVQQPDAAVRLLIDLRMADSSALVDEFVTNPAIIRLDFVLQISIPRALGSLVTKAVLDLFLF